MKEFVRGIAPIGLTLAMALAGAPTLAAQEADAWAVGSWEGTLEAGPQTLQIIYHVTRGDDGGLTGTMDVPAQGASGIPLTTVTVEGQTLTMTFPVPGGGTYEGAIDDSGVISGTFTQGPASFPMELARSEGAP
ncbi:MAG: hypothetical protein HKN72_08005 [Gemmatimonadetes bacterium]|nr:hypothetical protein [Gemmatimonadota bacterium]